MGHAFTDNLPRDYDPVFSSKLSLRPIRFSEVLEDFAVLW